MVNMQDFDFGWTMILLRPILLQMYVASLSISAFDAGSLGISPLHLQSCLSVCVFHSNSFKKFSLKESRLSGLK